MALVSLRKFVVVKKDYIQQVLKNNWWSRKKYGLQFCLYELHVYKEEQQKKLKYVTNSIFLLNIKDHFFETTFILDNIHFRSHNLTPCHIHLRPQSFYSAFLLDNNIFRSHSFHAMSKWSCFDLLWITFLWSTFHFFAGLERYLLKQSRLQRSPVRYAVAFLF